MSKRDCMMRRQEEINECIVYLAERAFIIYGIIFSIVSLIILIWGNMHIRDIEEEYKIHYNVNYSEKPLNLKMKQYWDGIEVPEEYLRNKEVSLEKEIKEKKKLLSEKISEKYNQEKELLAQVMYAEEGLFYLKEYKSDPAKVERVFKLCGSVVLNRTEIEYLGCKTIEETVFFGSESGKLQYAEQTQQRVREGQEIPDIVYQWADELLMSGPIGPKGLIYQAQFEQGDEVYAEIGNQIFCIDYKYN